MKSFKYLGKRQRIETLFTKKLRRSLNEGNTHCLPYATDLRDYKAVVYLLACINLKLGASYLSTRSYIEYVTSNFKRKEEGKHRTCKF
jgi:hypothetical protein